MKSWSLQVPAGTLPCPPTAAVWQHTAAHTGHPAVLGSWPVCTSRQVCVFGAGFVSERSEGELKVQTRNPRQF